MISPLERTVRTFTLRVAASAICVVLFVGLTLNAYFIERVTQVGLLAVIPLTAAVFLLPRHTRSGQVAGAPASDAPLLERLQRLGTLATTLRIVYLGIAVVCFFLLPALIPAPSPA